MMRTRIVCLLSTIFLFTGISVFAQSQSSQSNFSISPPPIPWFEWQEKQSDMRFGGIYTSMSGDGMSLKGGGFNFIGRYAFTDLLAFDLGMSVLGAGGYGPALSDIWFLGYSIPFDLEVQILKKENITILLFAGFNINRIGGGGSFWTGLDYKTVTFESFMYGPQGGAQISIKLSDFTISPFLMLQKLSGSGSVTTDYGTDSKDIPSVTMKTYGFDIIYVPYNITLSGVLQNMPKSGDNQEIKTYIFTLGYDYRFFNTGDKSSDDSTSDKKSSAGKKNK